MRQFFILLSLFIFENCKDKENDYPNGVALEDYNLINGTIGDLADYDSHQVPKYLHDTIAQGRKVAIFNELLSINEIEQVSGISIDSNRVSIIEDKLCSDLIKKLFLPCEGGSMFIEKSKLNRNPNYDVILLNREMLNDYFENNKGYILYSKISYNEDKTKACFYFENFCGEMCGYGKIIVAEKIAGNWQITNKLTLWVS